MALESTYEGRTRGECVICVHSMSRHEVSHGHTDVLPCRHRFHAACLSRWTEAQYSLFDRLSCPTCRNEYEDLRNEGDPYEILPKLKFAVQNRCPPPHGEVEVELIDLDTVLVRGRRTVLRVTLRCDWRGQPSAVFRVITLRQNGLASFLEGVEEKRVALLDRDWDALGRAATASVRELLEAVLG